MIEDYVVIGNCRSAALVSRFGSIDWCCLPEFHSPAIFAALLDPERGGLFMIAPAGDFRSSIAYLPDTNVVEIKFHTNDGEVRLTDAFVVMEEAEKTKSIFPDHEILRIVECTSGTVEMRFDYQPRENYGKDAVKLRSFPRFGLQFGYRENIITLISSLGDLAVENGCCTARFVMNAGDKVEFSLNCSNQQPAIIPALGPSAARRMDQTIAYWKNWSARCKYDGIYKEAVLRSALALKLLAHASSGAIIAAPTTSLPEEIGGVRNWDYRFCWLRDASFTVRVLTRLGYLDEAEAYMSWILHATRLTRPRLQVVYNVFGISKLKEKNCDWLRGFRDSKPVRTGNGAHTQFQLDVYGEVLDAVYTYSKLVDTLDNDTRRFVIGLGKVICRSWQQADEGIWEIRSEKQHHTHSKVMAWVALDRLVKLCRRFGWKAPVQQFESVAHAIRRSIETEGFKTDIESYTQVFGGDAPDAALLVLPLVGYCKADDPKMISTLRFITGRLVHAGFVYRHRNTTDGLPGSEGAFLVSNFWMVENLAGAGKIEEAKKLFEHTIGVASNGLLSEEIDPASQTLLANYPQGFSHIGLVNAAMAIDEALRQEKGSRPAADVRQIIEKK